MLSLDLTYADLSPQSSSFNNSNMPDPSSPTYSIPSPFSSGSSASYYNRSPISDPLDTAADLDQRHHPHLNVMENYSVGYSLPPSSVVVYNELGHIMSHPQDVDFSSECWTAPETLIAPKRQQPPTPPLQSLHFQHRSPHSTRDFTNDVDGLKNLALLMSSTSPSAFHQQQRQSPAAIRSPVPLHSASQVSPQGSPSLNNHSPQANAHSNRHPPGQYLDVDMAHWRASSATSQQANFSQPYASARPDTVGVYRSISGDLSQHPSVRRSMTDPFPNLSDASQHLNEDHPNIYIARSPHGHQDSRQKHMLDFSAPSRVSLASPSPHMLTQPHSPSYYHGPHADQTQQDHREISQQGIYTIRPTEVSSVDPSVRHSVFDPSSVEIGYSRDAQYQQTGYNNNEFSGVCDPQYLTGCVAREKTDLVDSGSDSDQNSPWEAQYNRSDTGFADLTTIAAGGQLAAVNMADHEVDTNADADADGEDDLETDYLSSGYAPPQQQEPNDAIQQISNTMGESLELGRPVSSLQFANDDDDDEDFESEDDEARDPEFVIRQPRRRASGSSPYAESRSLRSSKYNHYPSCSPTSSTGHYHDEYQTHSHSQQASRPRRAFSHNFTSPSPSDSYSALSANGTSPRRNNRTATSLSMPVPVPNLTKKSRGRRVPTMDDVQDDKDSRQVQLKTKKKCAAGSAAKGVRTYTCNVDGCGKLFARGEHLKRHVRSIHTYEKPHRCPYPGCNKDFSRHDNLGQHMRVHKDYVPPRLS